VGVVIDGVYRPRNGVGFGDLGELERIEVLKGPQGTLFGKNTSAGVINIVTKRPSFDFGSQFELSAGDYGHLEGSASVTGPLGRTVAGRLYVGARERDGFQDVVRGNGPRTADDDFDRKVRTARGQLLFTPSDALDIRLTADYSERDENCCGGVQVANGPTAAAINFLAGGAGLENPPDPFRRVEYLNRGTDQEIEDYGASLEINWDLDGLGGATLTSVSAWRNWESVNAQDTDFTAADIWHRDLDGNQATEFGQFSQELRLAGETDRMNWLFGAFYAREDLDSRQQLQFGTQFRQYISVLTGAAAPLLAFIPADAYPLGQGTRDLHEQESETWALFTNNSFRLTDAMELTLGLRYTNESKDLDSSYRNTHNAAGCTAVRANFLALQANMAALNLPQAQRDAINRVTVGIGCLATADPIYSNLDNSQSLDENEWSGTAKLAYRFTPDVMAYGSYARGYKASGFNLDRVRIGSAAFPTVQPALDTRFDRELVDSYELGMKTQWLNNSLLLNAAVFYQDYDDFQLNTFDGVQFLVTSLEQVTSEGVDLDFLWFTPLEQLSIQGGVTYADTKIKDSAALANPGLFDPNRENDRLSFAPEWSGGISGTFEQPMGSNYVWRTNIGVKYTSEYNTGSNLAPQKKQDDVTTVNARTGFGSADETWMVEAWAQNLTDEEYYQVVFDAPLQTGTYNAFLAAPRTYGVTARFRF
jgi:iron complex outermembrane recepter protein